MMNQALGRIKSTEGSDFDHSEQRGLMGVSTLGKKAFLSTKKGGLDHRGTRPRRGLAGGTSWVATGERGAAVLEFC